MQRAIKVNRLIEEGVIKFKLEIRKNSIKGLGRFILQW